ncbi:YdeI/OmpD-associated family protein [Arthrobacter sp. Br18]|uniref:YdeI/OmpD-associated family protein n=1 Tax=Arthrobacter sp. Br18 TaxID=1312954 RepID=UPI0004795B3F|nr:YdeI/OmpD-associated family protein [Arthrobacter sp. Br18]
MKPEVPELLLQDAAEWRRWLEENHAASPGVWLVLSKKGGSLTTLTYAQALDEALCFGWIDGQIRPRDAMSFGQRFTRRAARSIWSVRNRGHVERLEGAGRMQPAGRVAVQAAVDDGRWERAYAGSATAEVPADLLAAIAGNPAAQAMFDVLSAQNRYALIFRLSQLKTEAARQRNIAAFTSMLGRGETPYPQRAHPPTPNV